MNANARIGHQQLTATQVLVSTRTGHDVKEDAPRLVRIGRCLIAPAVVAVLMLGAHWNVFGSVTEPESEAVEHANADAYFPAEYGFRAADFDDPVNYR